MSDQAQELRKLMMGAERADSEQSAPRIIVFTGGKGGAGTTTLCVHVAVTLAKRGERVVLLDANGAHGNVGAQCGIVEDVTFEAVLAGRIALVDALQPGPEGVLVVPAEWAGERARELTRPMVERLVAKIQQTGEITDWVLIDLSSDDQQTWQPLWTAANEIVVVGNPDAVAMMDTYARIKTLAFHGCRSILTAINQAYDDHQADESHLRLARTARRFLSLNTVQAGSVPIDPLLASYGRELGGDKKLSSAGAASRAFDGIATVLIQRLSQENKAHMQ